MAIRNSVSTYYGFAIFIMIVAMIMFAHVTRMMFFGQKKSFKEVLKNPVMVAWYMLLPPNMIATLLYFLEHFVSVVKNVESEEGSFCTFIAFWAIAAIVALNGSAVVIAFITYKLVKDGKKPELRLILQGNAVAWLLGLVVASFFLSGGSIGPYDGLYCCVKSDLYKGWRVAIVFVVFCLSISSQMAFYYMAYHTIKQQESSMGAGGATNKTKASEVIMKRGIEMVVIFYVCWGTIAINSIISFAGGHPSIWASAFGAWAAKMNPVFHCLVMYRNLRRINKISAVAATSAATSSVSEGLLVNQKMEVVQANTQIMLENLNQVVKIQKSMMDEQESLKTQMKHLTESVQDHLAKASPVEKPPKSTVDSALNYEAQIRSLQEQNNALINHLIANNVDPPSNGKIAVIGRASSIGTESLV